MKNSNVIKAAALSALAFAGCSGNQQNTSTDAEMLGDKRIDDIVAQLTLEQKVSLVMGRFRGFATPPDAAPGMPDRYGEIERAKAENTFQPQVEETSGDETKIITAFSKGRVAGAAADGYSIDEFGIPVVVYADGPAGVRIDPTRKNDTLTYYCTAFPTGTILAASWDVEAVEVQTRDMGNEALEYGVDVLLAPAINIHRNPLCGRNFEYFSEDPLLTGKIAAAYIRGIQSNGVGTSLKHFAVNNQETMRNGIDAQVDPRTLREIYLRAFEIAVKEARPWTLMSSYNKINGTMASECEWLSCGILRDEWGFDGVVMTDWWAEENGARQIAAGNDLLMPGTQHQYDEIVAAVKDGSLPMATLDRNVKNVLRLVAKTPAFKGYKYNNHPDLESHAKTAHKVALEGITLLENNDKTLPMASGLKVALFGNASYDTYVGGSGSGYVNRKYKVNISDGLKNAGYSVVGGISDIYSKHIAAEKSKYAVENFWVIPVIDELKLTQQMVDASVGEADVVVFTLGRMAGEGGDRKLAKGDYYLSDIEQANLKMVSSAAHKLGKRVVMLLNMGSIVQLTEEKKLVDALVHVWMPGQEAGNAIADILSGQANPSGKLPLTWAKNYSDYPSSSDFPLSEGETGAVRYSEGIFVGYRHFDEANIEPLYPFGYGLSYTSFRCDGLKTDIEPDMVKVTATVANNGEVAGREAVLLFVSSPQGLLDTPKRELRAFAKTAPITPGQKADAEMSFRLADLASYDPSENKWVVADGEYVVSVESPGCEKNAFSASATILVQGGKLVDGSQK